MWLGVNYADWFIQITDSWRKATTGGNIAVRRYFFLWTGWVFLWREGAGAVDNQAQGESDSEYLKRVNNLGKIKVTGYILEN